MSENGQVTGRLHSVLFVDDEPKVLQGLERMLRPLRAEWTMSFVGGADEALAALAEHTFDVIVTDLRMPGTNGAELMELVLERHPGVIRFALSGHAEREIVVRAVRLAHQYLSKPCEGETLREKLGQAVRLRRLMECPRLREITSGLSSLRAVPSLYTAVLAEIESANPSALKVGEIIAQDPGMTAKVLQLINSAFFSMRAHVSDPGRAVQLLGLDTIKALVLSVQVFSTFKGRGCASPSAIWEHSTRTARIARELATRLGLDGRGLNEAFTAGLLHDVGKLVLADAMPEYESVLQQGIHDPVRAIDIERETFGASHAEVGAYLFGLWGLPYGIVEAVAWHHRPSESGVDGRCALTAVHAANAIDHELTQPTQAHAAVDDQYLATLGLAGEYAGWKSGVAEHHTAA